MYQHAALTDYRRCLRRRYCRRIGYEATRTCVRPLQGVHSRRYALKRSCLKIYECPNGTPESQAAGAEARCISKSSIGTSKNKTGGRWIRLLWRKEATDNFQRFQVDSPDAVKSGHQAIFYGQPGNQGYLHSCSAMR